MARALVLVMDSVGIGGAPDAASYGDSGANTVLHIAEACAAGAAESGHRRGPLCVPHLVAMGLGDACRLATGRVPPGLNVGADARATFACAAERSHGKDTPSGHWELAGVPVPFAWGLFPDSRPSFPAELVQELCARAEIPGILGDRHASGTEIIAELGEEHIRTGKPICYTSADSVFQIAAHEQTFGLDRLYRLCAVAKPLTALLDIARVIARPFVGDPASGFTRTGHRRDYMTPPPRPTLLDAAADAGRAVISVGKIGDIFAHRGTGEVLPAHGNDALFDRTLQGCEHLADGGLLFANFIDFDSLFGHRRDVSGYALALEQFDRRLPELLARLHADDLLIVTADHGCDPTWHGTDHTREQVPVLVRAPAAAGSLGQIAFADVGGMVAAHLSLEFPSGAAVRPAADTGWEIAGPVSLSSAPIISGAGHHGPGIQADRLRSLS
jgi:phosphopentomutase